MSIGHERVRSTECGADQGFTLVELLVALLVLSLAAVAILGGVLTSINGSSLVRGQADVSAVVENAAEVLKADAYISCSALTSGSSYSLPSSSGESDVNPATITAIQYWSASSFVSVPPGSCPSSDQLEEITVQATAKTSAVAQTLTIVKGNR